MQQLSQAESIEPRLSVPVRRPLSLHTPMATSPIANRCAPPTPLPVGSSSSLAPTGSVRSKTSRVPPRINTSAVVTSPPWARDEPPSPKDLTSPDQNRNRSPSDAVSYASSSYDESNSGSRWWSFTMQRPRENPPLPRLFNPDPTSPSREKRSMFKDRSMSWLPTSNRRSQDVTAAQREKGATTEPVTPVETQGPSPWDLQIEMPPKSVFSRHQPQTPGWDSPWTPRVPGPIRVNGRDSPSYLNAVDTESVSSKNPWAQKKAWMVKFLITNVYVPLLFRFINITFTTAALAMAIRIRLFERKHDVRGAVGSSGTLVIIFAPLTLLHVMVAVYLEYFGRPLGLWRTSAKLAHTLSEVLFICAWSASFSLCFDNYFTSIVPCVSPATIAWYNQIPRTADGDFPDLGRHEGGVGDTICDDQVALIILVGAGLIMYCINLVISLFRIFEKVKARL